MCHGGGTVQPRRDYALLVGFALVAMFLLIADFSSLGSASETVSRPSPNPETTHYPSIPGVEEAFHCRRVPHPFRV
jgi:hypothetical protein